MPLPSQAGISPRNSASSPLFQQEAIPCVLALQALLPSPSPSSRSTFRHWKEPSGVPGSFPSPGGTPQLCPALRAPPWPPPDSRRDPIRPNSCAQLSSRTFWGCHQASDVTTPPAPPSQIAAELPGAAFAARNATSPIANLDPRCPQDIAPPSRHRSEPPPCPFPLPPGTGKRPPQNLPGSDREHLRPLHPGVLRGTRRNLRAHPSGTLGGAEHPGHAV